MGLGVGLVLHVLFLDEVAFGWIIGGYLLFVCFSIVGYFNFVALAFGKWSLDNLSKGFEA